MKILNLDNIDGTLTDIFDLLTGAQEDNIRLLVESLVVTTGLKLDSNNDFNFYISEGNLYCNIGSCVFGDYTFFVAENNQLVSLEINWEQMNKDHLLCICKDAPQWSHSYSAIPVSGTSGAGSTPVYGKNAAFIAIVAPGSLLPQHIPLASLNYLDKTITDLRYSNQLSLLAPTSPRSIILETHSIKKISAKIKSDIADIDKPRPGCMHKGRRVEISFSDKASFHNESFLGFALKFRSDSGPSEYLRYFSDGEVIQDKIYLSSIVPHELDKKLTIEVIAFFSAQNEVSFISGSTTIEVIPDQEKFTCKILPLFDNSGILRFTFSNNSVEPIDYLLYLFPTNIVGGPINDDVSFQVLVQGNEYDYIMPDGFSILRYKIRSVSYGRAGYYEYEDLYMVFNKRSDRIYAMSLNIPVMDIPAASGRLFTIRIEKPISIEGAQISKSSSSGVVDGGEIDIHQAGESGVQFTYNEFGEGKNLNLNKMISDEMEVDFTSDSVSDLSECTLTILYKFAG